MKLQSALLLLLFLSGCGGSAPHSEAKHPYQRFVPVVPDPNAKRLPWSGAFALDTKTGQLCWTYDIVNKTKDEMWPNIPYCKNLLGQYPD